MMCVSSNDLTAAEIRHLGVNVQMAIQQEKRRHRISCPPRWRSFRPRKSRICPVAAHTTATT